MKLFPGKKNFREGKFGFFPPLFNFFVFELVGHSGVQGVLDEKRSFGS